MKASTLERKNKMQLVKCLYDGKISKIRDWSEKGRNSINSRNLQSSISDDQFAPSTFNLLQFFNAHLFFINIISIFPHQPFLLILIKNDDEVIIFVVVVVVFCIFLVTAAAAVVVVMIMIMIILQLFFLCLMTKFFVTKFI